MITRPMLAEKVEDKNKLNFPMIATPKIDGIRCLRPDQRVLTRSFKPIPNKYIRNLLEKILPIGADGELISGDNFQDVTSHIMSFEGTPDFRYCMFDYVPDGDTTKPYHKRLEVMDKWYESVSPEIKKYIFVLPYVIINSLEELNAYEDRCLTEGYEGVILRKKDGPYKCGRSTWKERYLLKLKKFTDSEAAILGFMEQMINTNEQMEDKFGLSERSTRAEGMKPAGILGKFIAKDCKTGLEFNCGTGIGLTLELRKTIWENQDRYLGKMFKYKYQDYGIKDLPRLPVWLGFRDEKDMG